MKHELYVEHSFCTFKNTAEELQAPVAIVFCVMLHNNA